MPEDQRQAEDERQFWDDDAVWALQLAIRDDRPARPSHLAVCEAAAVAVVLLLTDPRAGDGEWTPRIQRWLHGRIRKVVRRGRNAAFAATGELDWAGAERSGAYVRAFVPSPVEAVPRALAKLQVDSPRWLREPSQHWRAGPRAGRVISDMADDDAAQDLLHTIWAALDGDPGLLDQVRIKGPAGALPSVFDVTALAASTVAAATLAVAEFSSVRSGGDLPAVRSHRIDASAAFRSEALAQPVGWELAPLWDPIAGNYRTSDGWIRLHTNYAWHREAALRALDLRDGDELTREVVAAVAAGRQAAELEGAVVDAGGCAAAMHTGQQWAKHPHGQFAVGQQPVELRRQGPVLQLPGTRSMDSLDGVQSLDRPLAGVRVLDLTRVIAGPVCTRTLAAWGAQVLRIDPPGFADVPAALPDTTAGKFCAALELRDEADRARFEALVARADVVVHGLRPGALDALGYDPQALRAINPDVVLATVNAYGWEGPWAQRRGFDSLVQLSCGIAAAGADAEGAGHPVALPAQALDHGTGYLLAAAVCRALTGRLRGEGTAQVRASLVGTANLLMGTRFSSSAAEFDLESRRQVRDTDWGPLEAVAQPGTIAGEGGWWDVPAGPLGRHPARFPVAQDVAAAPVDQGPDLQGRLIP